MIYGFHETWITKKQQQIIILEEIWKGFHYIHYTPEEDKKVTLDIIVCIIKLLFGLEELSPKNCFENGDCLWAFFRLFKFQFLPNYFKSAFFFDSS